MKWVLAMGLLLLAGSAKAAWLPDAFWTFPTTDDDRRDCSQPELPAPREGVLIRALLTWSGPVPSWTDTIIGQYGMPGTKPGRWAFPGTYTVTFVCADSSWNKSCPFTITGIKTKKNPPGKANGFGTR